MSTRGSTDTAEDVTSKTGWRYSGGARHGRPTGHAYGLDVDVHVYTVPVSNCWSNRA